MLPPPPPKSYFPSLFYTYCVIVFLYHPPLAHCDGVAVYSDSGNYRSSGRVCLDTRLDLSWGYIDTYYPDSPTRSAEPSARIGSQFSLITPECLVLLGWPVFFSCRLLAQ